MTTDSTVLTAACEMFAQALVNMPEYEEWQAARAARTSEAELADLSAELKQVNVDWRLAKAKEDPGAAALEQRSVELQARVQEHPASLRQQAAALALIEMLREVNQLVSASLGVDFAATAAPRQGGCCG